MNPRLPVGDTPEPEECRESLAEPLVPLGFEDIELSLRTPSGEARDRSETTICTVGHQLAGGRPRWPGDAVAGIVDEDGSVGSVTSTRQLEGPL